MYFDISDLDSAKAYKLLACTVVPRPIAWVVTEDEGGQPNAAPFSFFNVFSASPPTVCLGIGQKDGRKKDTLHNICRSGEFVINLVSEETLEAMNKTAIPFPRHVNELAVAGLNTEKSVKVSPPRIAESPVALECRLKQFIELDAPHTLVIAQVVAMHIRDSAVKNAERCYVDTPSLKLVGRMESPGWYLRTSDRFLMRQIPLDAWEQAAGAID